MIATALDLGTGGDLGHILGAIDELKTPYCDVCGRAGGELEVEVCRHCYDLARDPHPAVVPCSDKALTKCPCCGAQTPEHLARVARDLPRAETAQPLDKTSFIAGYKEASADHAETFWPSWADEAFRRASETGSGAT